MREVVSVVFEVEFDALRESSPPRVLGDIISKRLFRITAAALWSMCSDEYRRVLCGRSGLPAARIGKSGAGLRHGGTQFGLVVSIRLVFIRDRG